MLDSSPQQDQMIKLAIMAVGGQGGGVLSNWIVQLAEANGWHAQSTAVAGVAQRTGATIYYIEMAPGGGRRPVFALAPAPGDVDVLIAAEWMEAGRAVTRGFVTPDRTTLIASTHRALAVSEKIVPGDGRAPQDPVGDALSTTAKQVLAFDLQQPATETRSMISATLFGALARSDALPFGPEAFEETIRQGGRGIESSLAGFRAGLAGPPAAPEAEDDPRGEAASGPEDSVEAWEALKTRAQSLPDPVISMAMAGLRKVVDFQDTAYGAEYLDLLDGLIAKDTAEAFELSIAGAKYLANSMAYDDVIAVAHRKTRPARFARIEAEMHAEQARMHLTEFFHPRVDEFCGALPARWGRRIEARPRLAAWIDRRINRGRRVRSDTILGFVQLYLIAGLRGRRRGTLRHEIETAHRDAWLDLAGKTVSQDYALAVEILTCRRLIKGYSDTHSRGQSKFDRVLAAVPALLGREDAADWLRRLRGAALKDAEGTALDGALRTVASFTGSSTLN